MLSIGLSVSVVAVSGGATNKSAYGISIAIHIIIIIIIHSQIHNGLLAHKFGLLALLMLSWLLV